MKWQIAQIWRCRSSRRPKRKSTVTHNAALQLLDAVVMLSVLDAISRRRPARPRWRPLSVAAFGDGRVVGNDGKVAAWRDALGCSMRRRRLVRLDRRRDIVLGSTGELARRGDAERGAARRQQPRRTRRKAGCRFGRGAVHHQPAAACRLSSTKNASGASAGFLFPDRLFRPGRDRLSRQRRFRLQDLRRRLGLRYGADPVAAAKGRAESAFLHVAGLPNAATPDGRARLCQRRKRRAVLAFSDAANWLRWTRARS